MPGTVFQYWRVTLPFAGSQEAADELLPDESDDEHPAITARLAAAATARRTREAVFLMVSFQSVRLQQLDGSTLTPQGSLSRQVAYWLECTCSGLSGACPGWRERVS